VGKIEDKVRAGCSVEQFDA